MTIDSIKNKEKILESFLFLAKDDEISLDLVKKSLEMAEIDQNHLFLIFDEPIIDLLELYFEKIKNDLKIYVDNYENFSQEKIRNKIKFCVYKLFEILYEKKSANQKIYKFIKQYKNFKNTEIGPKAMIFGAKFFFKISSQIWDLIKDKSTDFNYYTKRATLAKIIFKAYKSMLAESFDLEKTKILIDEEIEKIMRFEKLKSATKKKLSKINEKISYIKNEFLIDENGKLKSCKNFINDLPFFRIMK